MTTPKHTVACRSKHATFPGRVARWVVSRLGEACLMDRQERARRLLEEAVELAQAEGVTHHDAAAIALRVYSRPAGEPTQEMGGVMVCVYGWCIAAGENVDDLTEREVSRIEAVPAEVTRAKHDAKADAGTARHSAPPPTCVACGQDYGTHYDERGPVCRACWLGS